MYALSDYPYHFANNKKKLGEVEGRGTPKGKANGHSKNEKTFAIFFKFQPAAHSTATKICSHVINEMCTNFYQVKINNMIL